MSAPAEGTACVRTRYRLPHWIPTSALGLAGARVPIGCGSRCGPPSVRQCTRPHARRSGRPSRDEARRYEDLPQCTPGSKVVPRPPDDAKTQRPQPIFPELLINHDLTRRPAAEEFRLGVLHRPVEFTDQPYPRPVEVGAPDVPRASVKHRCSSGAGNPITSMRTRLRDSPGDSASPSAKSRTVATRPRAAIDRIAAASETLPDPPFPVETRGHRQRSPPRNRRPQPAPRGSTRASSRRGPTHRQPEGRPRNSDDGARCHGSGLICPVPAGRGPSKARKPAAAGGRAPQSHGRRPAVGEQPWVLRG